MPRTRSPESEESPRRRHRHRSRSRETDRDQSEDSGSGSGDRRVASILERRRPGARRSSQSNGEKKKRRRRRRFGKGKYTLNLCGRPENESRAFEIENGVKAPWTQTTRSKPYTKSECNKFAEIAESVEMGHRDKAHLLLASTGKLFKDITDKQLKVIQNRLQQRAWRDRVRRAENDMACELADARAEIAMLKAENRELEVRVDMLKKMFQQQNSVTTTTMRGDNAADAILARSARE